MKNRFLLLSVVLISCSVLAADVTYSGNGITFNHPASIDVSAYPKKDGSGVMIMLSDARGNISGLITTHKTAVDAVAANNAQIQTQAALGGFPPNTWKVCKRKIGSVEVEGKTATNAKSTTECYAVVLGKQTIEITLTADKGFEKNAEPAFKLMLESLK